MPPKKRVKRDVSKSKYSVKKQDSTDNDFSDEESIMNGYSKTKKKQKLHYPNRMMMDFNLLDMKTLLRYCNYYNVPYTTTMTHSQLAIVVACHFDTTMEVDEEETISSFVRRVRNGERGGMSQKKKKDKLKKNKVPTRSTKTSSRKRTSRQMEHDDFEYEEDEDVKLYCICSRPSFGDMIACDGKNCQNPSQWYHLECVGLSPGQYPDTWLCPDCDD